MKLFDTTPEITGGVEGGNKWHNWKTAVDADREGVCNSSDASAPATFKRYGKWNSDNIEPLALIGKGSFGLVRLVRHRGTQEIFAMKQMSKAHFRQKNQRVYRERDAMAKAMSHWCAKLIATFQDPDHVYMVMEFVQGGDLYALLDRRQRLPEPEAIFYTAELLEAIDSVHRAGFVHRDLKPDNIMICSTGHLKLLDFGLCKAHYEGGNGAAQASALSSSLPDLSSSSTAEEGGGEAARGDRRQARSIAGTPQYMAPEAFVGEFGPEADLWAVGVICFECLTGSVLFQAREYTGIQQVKIVKVKVTNHVQVIRERFVRSRHFGFTSDISESFLRKVICVRDRRLRAEAMRQDPFFRSVDFERLHLVTPPFVPQLTSPQDVSFFDPPPLEARAASDSSSDSETDPRLPLPAQGPRSEWDKHLEWAHFDADPSAMR